MRRCSNCASAWLGKAWWSAVPLLHPRPRPCPPPHPRLLGQPHSIRLRNLPGTLSVRKPCLAAVARMAQAHAGAHCATFLPPLFSVFVFCCALCGRSAGERPAGPHGLLPYCWCMAHPPKNRCGRAAVRACAVASQSSVMRGRAWSARQAPFPFATHGLRHPLHGGTVGAAEQRACTQAGMQGTCGVALYQRLNGAACTPCSSQFMPRICASLSVLPAGRVNLPS